MKKKIILIVSMVLLCSTIINMEIVSAEGNITSETFTSKISDEDVLKGLNNQKKIYESFLLQERNSKRITQITELICTTEEMIIAYSKKEKSTKEIEPKASWFIEVSAVVGWFNLKGYNLAAELLTHAKENRVVDSFYDPINYSVLRYSPVFERISAGSKTSGSDAFPNSGDKYCKDLYYAVHAFTWTKNSTTTPIVRIYDRYDFEYNDRYSGLAGTAVNSMYGAQQDGYLKPYKWSMAF